MIEDRLRAYQGKNLDKLKKFDIDLDFGKHYEHVLAEILKKGKVEVKTERDTWKDTRNIAIELLCNGKSSGLNSTEADWGAHILSWKGNIISLILLPVDKLKELVKQSVQDGNGKVILGGDNNASEIALIPLEDLVNGF